MNKSKVILLHGAIGASDQLESIKSELEKDNFSVYIFEFSGHGKTSFSDAGFGIACFAEELKQFIIQHHLQGANIFGYSMGGYVALYLASQEPDLVEKIATLGTKFHWDTETAAKEAKMLDPQTIQSKVPKFADALINRHGDDKWEVLLEKTAGMMKELGANNILNNTSLEAIKNNVLLGLADNDNMVSFEETKHVQSHIANSSMYMLPKSKHPIESIDLKLLKANLLRFYTREN